MNRTLKISRRGIVAASIASMLSFVSLSFVTPLALAQTPSGPGVPASRALYDTSLGLSGQSQTGYGMYGSQNNTPYNMNPYSIGCSPLTGCYQQNTQNNS